MYVKLHGKHCQISGDKTFLGYIVWVNVFNIDIPKFIWNS